MKKTYIYIIIMFSIIVILVGLYFFIDVEAVKIDIDKNITIEINDIKYNTDYVKITNGSVVKREKIDTSKLGEQEVKIIVKDILGRRDTYTYFVEIKDTTAPKLVVKNKNLTAEIYKEIDLLDNVTVEDNSNEDITIKIEGSYHFKQTTSFNLKYTCSDSSGNTSEEEFTLKVIDQKPASDGTFTTSKGYSGIIKNGITYIDGYLIANKSYSLPSTYNPGKILPEFQTAFDQMKSDAKNEGISLKIVSGYRSYTTQKNLHYNYIKNQGSEKTETHSARAGYSEHQSGLAVDINKVNQSFANTTAGKWLNANCYKYGFIIRYPKDKTNETGYIYEPWHIRYVGKELAETLYNNGDWITMESYFGITSEYKDK